MHLILISKFQLVVYSHKCCILLLRKRIPSTVEGSGMVLLLSMVQLAESDTISLLLLLAGTQITLLAKLASRGYTVLFWTSTSPTDLFCLPSQASVVYLVMSSSSSSSAFSVTFFHSEKSNSLLLAGCGTDA